MNGPTAARLAGLSSVAVRLSLLVLLLLSIRPLGGSVI
jgi:hypothetical protein